MACMRARRIDALDRGSPFIVDAASDMRLITNSCSQRLRGFTTEFLMLDGISYAPVSAPDGACLDQYLRARWSALEQYRLGRACRLWRCRRQECAECSHLCALRQRARWHWARRAPCQRLPESLSTSRNWCAGMRDGVRPLDRAGLRGQSASPAPTKAGRGRIMNMRAEQVYEHDALSRGTGVKEAVEIGPARQRADAYFAPQGQHTAAGSRREKSYIDLVAVNEVDYSSTSTHTAGSSTMLRYLLPLEVWNDGVATAYGKLADPALRERQRRLETMNLAGSRFLDARKRDKPPPVRDDCRNGTCGAAPPLSIPCAGCSSRRSGARLQHRGWPGSGISRSPCYADGRRRRLLPQRQDPPAAVRLDRACWAITCGTKLTHVTGGCGLQLNGFSAARLSLRRRRRAQGLFADPGYFDPETVHDNATFDDPHQLSDGHRARTRQRRADPCAQANGQRRRAVICVLVSVPDQSGNPDWSQAHSRKVFSK